VQVRGGDSVKDSQVQQLEWMVVVASYGVVAGDAYFLQEWRGPR